MNLILRIITGLILNYPGAFIRWLLFEKNEPYSYYLKDISVNNFISIMTMTMLMILYIIIFN